MGWKPGRYGAGVRLREPAAEGARCAGPRVDEEDGAGEIAGGSVEETCVGSDGGEGATVGLMVGRCELDAGVYGR